MSSPPCPTGFSIKYVSAQTTLWMVCKNLIWCLLLESWQQGGGEVGDDMQQKVSSWTWMGEGGWALSLMVSASTPWPPTVPHEKLFMDQQTMWECLFLIEYLTNQETYNTPSKIKRDSYRYKLECNGLIPCVSRYGARPWPGSNVAQRAIWGGRWRETGCLHTQHQLFGYGHLKSKPHPVVMLQICRICTDNAWGLTALIPSVSDVPLVIYLHGGYWQFLRYCCYAPLCFAVQI